MATSSASERFAEGKASVALTNAKAYADGKAAAALADAKAYADEKTSAEKTARESGDDALSTRLVNTSSTLGRRIASLEAAVPGKQDALNDAQRAAVNSGITADLVALIGQGGGGGGGGSVVSVNGRTGQVVLGASDVHALSDEGGTVKGDVTVLQDGSSRTDLLVGGAIATTSVGGSQGQSSSMSSPGRIIVGSAYVDGVLVPASIMKDDDEVATEKQVFALAGYPIQETTGDLADRTVNTASTGGSFSLPDPTGYMARDFVLVVDASDTAPSVSFPVEDVEYVSDDPDVWVAEAGKVNEWYFHENGTGRFAVAHKAYSAAAQS